MRNFRWSFITQRLSAGNVLTSKYVEFVGEIVDQCDLQICYVSSKYREIYIQTSTEFYNAWLLHRRDFPNIKPRLNRTDFI